MPCRILGRLLLAAVVLLVGRVASADFFYPISSVSTNTVNFFSKENLIQGPGVGFLADAPYTAIGSASTFAGAALGTLIPIPFVGTLVGIAAGMGLGYLYEKKFRKNLVSKVQNALPL